MMSGGTELTLSIQRRRIAELEAERDAIVALLDKHDIARAGGSESWTLVDRVLIACRAAVSTE
jgi:hypothetical protein